jgi:hypothetical protein
MTRIFTDRAGKHFYRKGREGRKEDLYRGFTRMHADLHEQNLTTDDTDYTDFH